MSKENEQNTKPNSGDSVATLRFRINRMEGSLEDRFYFISKARAMEPVNEVLTQLRQESKSDSKIESTVLITGERGTGKEGVARMVHACSRRSQGPWIRLNCAQFSADMIEAEIFGMAKGATLGATTEKMGALELANGGTLLIDQIETLPQQAQYKLLKSIEEQSFRKVGGDSTLPMDVRIISSTDADLTQSGHFLNSLYQRLSQVTLKVPALKERSEDIIPLATHFAERSCLFAGKKFHGFTPELQDGLKEYSWPGHVWELFYRIELASMLWNGNGAMTLQDLNLPNVFSGQGAEVRKLQIVSSTPSVETNLGEGTYTDMKRHWCDAFEKEYLIQSLKKNRGNVSVAAREAKLDRSNFLRLLRRHGIKAQEYRSNQDMAKAA